MSFDHMKGIRFPVLDQGFVELVDVMGTDADIVQAARVSFGQDGEATYIMNRCHKCGSDGVVQSGDPDTPYLLICDECSYISDTRDLSPKDIGLLRYLMRNYHTTPFEMVEMKFVVQIPMDCWRQMVRHRTANINEYSTRYMPAIDSMQQTPPDQWRLQSKDNKQGSSGLLTEWPEGFIDESNPEDNDILAYGSPGAYLTDQEKELQTISTQVYEERLRMGVAKEQARKDLPLSTYTRAYWKCDLHNIFNFLRLRMDSHAQLEIRQYANVIANIVQETFPLAYNAFNDYILQSHRMSRMEMDIIRKLMQHIPFEVWNDTDLGGLSNREIDDFKKKVGL